MNSLKKRSQNTVFIIFRHAVEMKDLFHWLRQEMTKPFCLSNTILHLTYRTNINLDMIKSAPNKEVKDMPQGYKVIIILVFRVFNQ